MAEPSHADNGMWAPLTWTRSAVALAANVGRGAADSRAHAFLLQKPAEWRRLACSITWYWSKGSDTLRLGRWLRSGDTLAMCHRHRALPTYGLQAHVREMSTLPKLTFRHGPPLPFVTSHQFLATTYRFSAATLTFQCWEFIFETLVFGNRTPVVNTLPMQLSSVICRWQSNNCSTRWCKVLVKCCSCCSRTLSRVNNMV